MSDKPLSRIYVNSEDHYRVNLFARIERMIVRDAYELIIKAFLTPEGKIKRERKTSINLSLMSFKKLMDQAKKYGTTPEVLLSTMIDLADRYSELFKNRLF